MTSEIKPIWAFPFIEIESVTKTSPESVPYVLTITNEQRVPRRIPDEVSKEILSREFYYCVVGGLTYFISNNERGKIVSSPNRSEEIRGILESNISIRSYLEFLESQVRKVVSPGILNPGFEDFAQLAKRYGRPNQFLNLRVRDVPHERVVRVSIACSSSRKFPSRFLETYDGFLDIARIKYTEPKLVT